MNSEDKKKNILDLQFQKYLVISSTSVIMTFTYFLGVGIAVWTKQIILSNFIDVSVLFIVSSAFIGLCAIVFFKSVFHLRNILELIKNL